MFLDFRGLKILHQMITTMRNDYVGTVIESNAIEMSDVE